MDSQLLGLRAASAIFGFLSVAQLIRFLLRTDILVAGHDIPVWPSAVAFILLGSLSIWTWKLGSRKGPRR